MSNTFVRDEKGLIEGIEYVFNADGTIDWRKMIPKEFVVINSSKTGETDISKVPDENLLILLQGFRRLANIRGFSEVRHDLHISPSSPNFVAVSTSIKWLPNYETYQKEITFSACADAHEGNTKSFGINFLSAIAENRGFVRAVRGFLNIPILGRDEVTDDIILSQTVEKASSQAHETLISVLKNHKIPFASFTNKMIKEKEEGADSWQAIEDIPTDRIIGLIEKVQALIALKKKREAEKAV